MRERVGERVWEAGDRRALDAVEDERGVAHRKGDLCERRAVLVQRRSDAARKAEGDGRVCREPQVWQHIESGIVHGARVQCEAAQTREHRVRLIIIWADWRRRLCSRVRLGRRDTECEDFKSRAVSERVQESCERRRGATCELEANKTFVW